MQKIRGPLAVAWLVGAIVFLPGCKKVFDYLEDHPGGGAQYANIKTFTYSNHFNDLKDSNSVAITYNSWGDPAHATRQTGENDEGTDIDFFYDRQHRLTEVTGGNGNDSIIFNGQHAFAPIVLHKYYYDRYDRIVGDSTYNGPVFVNGQLVFLHANSDWFVIYTYDARNRLIKYRQISVDPVDTVTRTFDYDAAGNLIVAAAPGRVYDHEINFHRTNKIWMFLDRDYSMNNPLRADAYNALALPVRFTQSDQSNLTRFLNVAFENARIEYSTR